MSTKQIWLLLLGSVLVLAFSACHHPKPATAPAAAPPPPPAAAPAPPPPPPPPPAATPAPPPEDLLASQNLAVVNQELARRGFKPDVYFDFDASALSDETRTGLDTDSGLLKEATKLKLTLEGHCDERGTAEYNLALGERRASSVKAYLVSLGVDANRLQTISYGLERPVCTEHEESCWSKNRRVHLVVTGRNDAG